VVKDPAWVNDDTINELELEKEVANPKVSDVMVSNDEDRFGKLIEVLPVAELLVRENELV